MPSTTTNANNLNASFNPQTRAVLSKNSNAPSNRSYGYGSNAASTSSSSSSAADSDSSLISSVDPRLHYVWGSPELLQM